MKLDVKCQCNEKQVGLFICGIEPKNGEYTWLIEMEGQTYGGKAPTQLQAMEEAYKIYGKK